jgi:hypothetical protein
LHWLATMEDDGTMAAVFTMIGNVWIAEPGVSLCSRESLYCFTKTKTLL